ncbi:MAG: Gfo/Idh/MocA family oxidoreductase [Bacteroidota bacterium]
MHTSWSRREILKALGVSSAGIAFGRSALANLVHEPVVFPEPPALKPAEGPITAIVAGAGNRGNVYSSYALQFPTDLKIVGVAEPIPFRNDRFAKKYAIPTEHRFTTWEHIFNVPKFADAVIITTPDALHYGPAIAALNMGYDLVLEKPIAQTWQQCSEIMNLAKAKNRIVVICHVLRYAPFFRKIKEVIDSGTLGRMVSIQLMEPVEHVHMSHSFVRGNWRNTKESNPMLLAKSCHDLDLLLWYTDKHCTKISSFGSLTWFKPENAPKGSTARCTDGCAVESTCPYSALKIYYRNRTWLHHMDLPEEGDKGPAILEHLKTGPYGRCVYRCDNDVVDHQVVMMQFEDNITANFNMEAHTSYAGRRIRIMFTNGDIVGDEENLTFSDFTTGETVKWNVKESAQITSGHGGGDFGLVRNWLQAVNRRDPSILPTTIERSMESHLMAFRAEEARGTGTLKDVGLVE